MRTGRIASMLLSIKMRGFVRVEGYFHACSLTGGGRVAWILRLVKTGAEGEGHCTDVMEIIRPADLSDIADLGLTLADAKRLLVGLQQAIVAGQSGDHAAQRPACPRCGAFAMSRTTGSAGVGTPLSPVALRVPQFRCDKYGGIEAGIGWPSRCQSTPEMDQLQAHLCALMTYRTAAEVLEQIFPVDAGNDPETLRRHTLRTGEALQYCPAAKPETAAVTYLTIDNKWVYPEFRISISKQTLSRDAARDGLSQAHRPPAPSHPGTRPPLEAFEKNFVAVSGESRAPHEARRPAR